MMKIKLSVQNPQLCVGCQLCMYACSRRSGSGGLGQPAISVRSSGGMSKGFTIIVCRCCEAPPCVEACPAGALVQVKTGGIRLQKDKCTGCGLCRDACIIGAVFWDPVACQPDICVQCGQCALFCPHDVLALTKSDEGGT
ncbi:MAG TPA: 4Fe-4S binding protein [Candidatus Mcinerneyibacteriales bacterium]|nr:4Fe-4S binding protein [Candidatus Mcinerneyibacteriales bacterium]HPJ69338.1 4Fe-4S binding protein [Candidatus Mcinerneyibacteriales bacterium]